MCPWGATEVAWSHRRCCRLLVERKASGRICSQEDKHYRSGPERKGDEHKRYDGKRSGNMMEITRGILRHCELSRCRGYGEHDRHLCIFPIEGCIVPHFEQKSVHRVLIYSVLQEMTYSFVGRIPKHEEERY